MVKPVLASHHFSQNLKVSWVSRKILLFYVFFFVKEQEKEVPFPILEFFILFLKGKNFPELWSLVGILQYALNSETLLYVLQYFLDMLYLKLMQVHVVFLRGIYTLLSLLQGKQFLWP